MPRKNHLSASEADALIAHLNTYEQKVTTVFEWVQDKKITATIMQDLIVKAYKQHKY